jgi:hypothetical protein
MGSVTGSFFFEDYRGEDCRILGGANLNFLTAEARREQRVF